MPTTESETGVESSSWALMTGAASAVMRFTEIPRFFPAQPANLLARVLVQVDVRLVLLELEVEVHPIPVLLFIAFSCRADFHRFDGDDFIQFLEFLLLRRHLAGRRAGQLRFRHGGRVGKSLMNPVPIHFKGE